MSQGIPGRATNRPSAEDCALDARDLFRIPLHEEKEGRDDRVAERAEQPRRGQGDIEELLVADDLPTQLILVEEDGPAAGDPAVDLDTVFVASSAYDCDFSDVRGQELVKRALIIAAAGAHNVLMIGPSGSSTVTCSARTS